MTFQTESTRRVPRPRRGGILIVALLLASGGWLAGPVRGQSAHAGFRGSFTHGHYRGVHRPFSHYRSAHIGRLGYSPYISGAVHSTHAYRAHSRGYDPGRYYRSSRYDHAHGYRYDHHHRGHTGYRGYDKYSSYGPYAGAYRSHGYSFSSSYSYSSYRDYGYGYRGRAPYGGAYGVRHYNRHGFAPRAFSVYGNRAWLTPPPYSSLYGVEHYPSWRKGLEAAITEAQLAELQAEEEQPVRIFIPLRDVESDAGAQPAGKGPGEDDGAPREPARRSEPDIDTNSQSAATTFARSSGDDRAAPRGRMVYDHSGEVLRDPAREGGAEKGSPDDGDASRSSSEGDRQIARSRDSDR